MNPLNIGLTEKTQVFTENGWKEMKDLDEFDKVANIDEDNTFYFSDNYSVHPYSYNNYMYQIKNPHLNAMFPCDSFMYSEKKYGYKNWDIVNSIDSSSYNLKTTSQYQFPVKKRKEDDDRLQGYMDGLLYVHGIKCIDEGYIHLTTSFRRYRECLFYMFLDNAIYKEQNNIHIIRIPYTTINIIHKEKLYEHILSHTFDYAFGFFMSFYDFYGKYLYVGLDEHEFDKIEWVATLLGYNLVIDKENCVNLGKNIISVNKHVKEDSFVRYHGTLYNFTNETGKTLILHNYRNLVSAVNKF